MSASRVVCAGAAWPDRVPGPVERGSGRTTVSTRLFHARQARHWPSQRRTDSPHAWQTYRVRGRPGALLMPDAAPSGGRSGLDRRQRLGGVDVGAGVRVAGDEDRRAGLVLAEQEVLGEDVLDHVLDPPAQRTGAIRHVVAELDDVLLGRSRDLELHRLGAQLIVDPGEHQVDDLGDLLDRERAEDYRGVDPVEELRPEVVL